MDIAAAWRHGRHHQKYSSATTVDSMYYLVIVFPRAGSQSAFQGILKVFDGVEVRALCGPVMYFLTGFDKQFLDGPRFVHGGIVMLKQERAFPKLLPQSW